MTKIEWTEKTWNPIVGCSVVSPGCTNCYAMRMAARIEAMGTVPHYAGMTRPSKAGAVWRGKVAMAPDRVLTEPTRRKKPTTWFVNSMGDLFHESVPDEWIDRVFAVMALCPQHRFQCLTKRSKRMREYCSTEQTPFRVARQIDALAADQKRGQEEVRPIEWPLPNVWLGVSAEDQTRADERIPDLLATPAAVRFVSAEPLLGPVDFMDIPWPSWRATWPETNNVSDGRSAIHQIEGTRIDWVIAGSESGPSVRPCNLDWVRSIRDQCVSAKVPFFWKQHVEAGRKMSTPVLDGKTWKEFPTIR
jgi:protein gp37